MCMGVVCHNCGWLGECRYGGGGGHACGTKPGWVGRMSGDAGALPECELIY